MFTIILIDWENIESTVKKEYGSVLNYDEFISTIKKISSGDSSQIVSIQAYGDFDKGIPGIMSRLINLGVEPHHIVTKTAKSYLKGSTDIELSLNVLETMFTYPHIANYVFVSGDSDLRYIIKRLKIHGKNVKILGFAKSSSLFLKEMASDYQLLDDYKEIMRKVTKTDQEQQSLALISDKHVEIVIRHVNKVEQEKNLGFLSLNYLRRCLIEYYDESATEISDAITKCLECKILEVKKVPNPNDEKHPTQACSLNRNNIAVQHFLNKACS